MKLITIKIYKGDAYDSWTLPKEIASTKENRISAQFETGTADTLRGLTFDEEKKYLPNIVGTTPDNQQWREVTREYWSNMSILVPSEGLILNVGLYPEGHEKVGEPENIQQYIMYRFILKHGSVSKNKNLVEWPKHKFYISDESVIKEEQTQAFELRNKANKAFMFLQSEKGLAKLEWVALCLREKGERIPKTVNDILMFVEDKKNEVRDKAPVGLTKFLKVVNDESLEQRAMLYKLDSEGIIEKNGNTYFFGGDVMGNEVESVAWLKNPVNSKSLLQMNERLKTQTV